MATRVNEFGQPIGPDVDGWRPRDRPDPGVLTGTSVRLERLTASHVPSLFANVCGPGSDASWTYMPQGPFTDEAALAAYLGPMSISPDSAPLAIVSASSGEVVGVAVYLRMRPLVGAVEVGAITFGPALVRTRGATEAMWLMARHVFDDLGYRRYEWKCDALHAKSRRAAGRLGFSYEGTWRDAVVYKGRSRDTAWFAMTADDWQHLRPRYDAWLAAASDDRQASSLSDLTRPLLRATDPG